MTAEEKWTSFIHYLIGHESMRAATGQIPSWVAKRIIMRAIKEAIDAGIDHAVLYAAVRDGQARAERALEEFVVGADVPRINAPGCSHVDN